MRKAIRKRVPIFHPVGRFFSAFPYGVRVKTFTAFFSDREVFRTRRVMFADVQSLDEKERPTPR